MNVKVAWIAYPLILMGVGHLLRTLREYVEYYNEVRTISRLVGTLR